MESNRYKVDNTVHEMKTRDLVELYIHSFLASAFG
jgi:hypothetical protein